MASACDMSGSLERDSQVAVPQAATHRATLPAMRRPTSTRPVCRMSYGVVQSWAPRLSSIKESRRQVGQGEASEGTSRKRPRRAEGTREEPAKRP
mmetsp:Transcript_142630/g.397445  ORF Transcript_142630/g.397445 Transcript_142630/m.397445 type:complete len:95 (+) Transcript_142630:1405-1689(+)